MITLLTCAKVFASVARLTSALSARGTAAGATIQSRQSRYSLLSLDDRTLRDIGLDRTMLAASCTYDDRILIPGLPATLQPTERTRT